MNKSLPNALKLIEEAVGKSIVFSYTEVEKYTVNVTIENKTQTEAIAIALSSTPFVAKERANYFVINNKNPETKHIEIRGKVLDEDGKPLPYANVLLLNDSDSSFVDGCMSGDNGNFMFLAIEGGKYKIRASVIGYATVFKNVGTDNVVRMKRKAQMLKEVEVVEAVVIEKPDKYLILPSKTELDRATNSLTLLSELKLKMPGLRVDELLGQIKVDGSSPVLMINGKERPMSRILALNHKDILRIEYTSTPDIRYADKGACGVINFIMKPSYEGGSVLARTNNALTTTRSNTLVNSSYYHKKSEWNFSYDNVWRESKKEYTNAYEEFIGREYPIIREQIGLPSSTKDFDNDLMLDYTYMYDPKTMFVATGGFRYHTHERFLDYLIRETYGDNVTEYQKSNNTEYTHVVPSLDLYFRKSWQNKSSLELNMVGTMSNGDYERVLSNTNDYSQKNVTGNNSWTIRSEVMYSHVHKNISLRYGLKYTRGYAENDYTENGSQKVTDKLTSDNVYFYGSMAGTLSKLGYTFNVGGKYFRSEDVEKDKSYIKANSTITFNYPLSKKFSLNYLFLYSPSLPSLASLSDVVQTVDDITVQTGNVDVKPSEYTRNRIMARFNTGKLYTTLQGSFNYTDNPIINRYIYVSDKSSLYYDKFMSVVENGGYIKNINVELTLGYQNLFNHISIQAYMGWDKYKMSGADYGLEASKLYAAASVNAYWGNWRFYIFSDFASRASYYGTEFYKGARQDYLGASYKLKNWDFSCMFAYPFCKRGMFQKEENVSKVHPSRREFYIKDFSNMVQLTIQYRVNFGKAFEKSQRSLSNKGIDTGVNVSY